MATWNTGEWKGKFLFSGQDYGYSPVFYMRDMQLVKIVPRDNIQIGTVMVKGGTTLFVERGGTITIPK